MVADRYRQNETQAPRAGHHPLAESGTPRGPPYRGSCALARACLDLQWWRPVHSAACKTQGMEPGGQLAGGAFLTFRVISLFAAFTSTLHRRREHYFPVLVLFVQRFRPPVETFLSANPCARVFRLHPCLPRGNFTCFCLHSAGTGLAKLRKYFQNRQPLGPLFLRVFFRCGQKSQVRVGGSVLWERRARGGAPSGCARAQATRRREGYL